MGYDMTWIDPPDNEAAQKAANDQFNAAVRERDQFPRDSAEAAQAQKKVEVAWDAMDNARPEYFRLNIWGMSDCRSHMADFGMICSRSASSVEAGSFSTKSKNREIGARLPCTKAQVSLSKLTRS